MSSPQERSASDIVPKTTAETEIRPVDDVDREIIRLLQRDGRASNTEIGRALGVTETTIRKRIARLISEGLVSIVAVPTPQAVGMTTSAIIGISVALHAIRSVSDQLVAQPEVR